MAQDVLTSYRIRDLVSMAVTTRRRLSYAASADATSKRKK